MAKPFFIKNQAQFQVFNSFFASAIVGLSSKLWDERSIAKQADAIAVECIRKFNSHVPTKKEDVMDIEIAEK